MYPLLTCHPPSPPPSSRQWSYEKPSFLYTEEYQRVTGLVHLILFASWFYSWFFSLAGLTAAVWLIDYLLRVTPNDWILILIITVNKQSMISLKPRTGTVFTDTTCKIYCTTMFVFVLLLPPLLVTHTEKHHTDSPPSYFHVKRII